MLYRALLVCLLMNTPALFAQSSSDSFESSLGFTAEELEELGFSPEELEEMGFDEFSFETTLVEDEGVQASGLSDDDFSEVEISVDGSDLFLDLKRERECPIESLRQLYEVASNEFEYMDAVIIEREVLSICAETTTAYTRLVNLEDQLFQQWSLYQKRRRQESEEEEVAFKEFENIFETSPIEIPSAPKPIEPPKVKNRCPAPSPAKSYLLRGTITIGGQVYASFELASPEGKAGAQLEGNESEPSELLSYTASSGGKLPGDVEVVSVSPAAGEALLRDCAGTYIARM